MSETKTRTKPARESVFFILLLLACTAVRCVLSVTNRAAGSTGDETLVLELAQNIRLYGRLTLYGIRTNYAGILYPALLAPFFGIRDPETRLAAISVLNALLASSAMIPAWMICRKLLKKEAYRLAAIMLFALTPGLWLSVTGMPENLFIPLAMWGIWFLLRAFEKGAPDIRTACGLGLWTYLLFITSKAGIATAGGMLALFAYEAATGKDGGKALFGGLGFTAAFAAAYLLVMAAVFGGGFYCYPELAGNVTAPPQFMFWLYAALCMLLWFCAGSLFLPVLIPAACRRQQDAEQKRLFRFLSVYTVLAAALTTYAVSVPEEFGRMDIRIILRPLIPAPWLFAVLFLATPEGDRTKQGIRRPLFRAAAWLAVLCLLFLRIPGNGSLADAPSLQLFGKLSGGSFRTIAARAAAAILIAAGCAAWTRGKGKAVTACVTVALLALGAVNGALTLRQAERASFSDEEKTRAIALGKELDALDGKILVISSDPGSAAQRLTDIYCDTDYYLIETDALRRMAIGAEEPGIIPADASWTEGEKTGAFHIRNTEQRIGPVSYIVCADGEPALTGGQYRDCTPEGITGARVYRNGDPGRIDALDLFAFKAWEEIRFTAEAPEHLRFPVSGFSDPESGFTWSEGNEATITLIPVPEGQGRLELYWSRKMTIGEQRYEVYAGDELLAEGTASGPGEELIRIPEELTGKREPVTFRFVFPDARQPDNGDPRILAVAFESIALAEN